MHVPSTLDLAIEALVSGAVDLALQLTEELLAADPDNADALHLRGFLALNRDAAEEAVSWLKRSVEISAHPRFCNSLSVAQARLGDYAAAIESAQLGLRMAAQHFPDVPTALLWYNLGIAFQKERQLEAAAASYREVLARDANHSSAHNNLGTMLNELGYLALGIAHFERAIELDPQNLEARSNLGHALLAAGRYEHAWPFFEYRWASLTNGIRQAPIEPPRLPIPRWSGDTPSAGAALLVLNEQGFGDALHFCRYVPIAAERFARVGYVCPKPLRRLFEQSLCARWPNIELLDAVPNVASGWSNYCSLMSLPTLFGTRVETIPAPVPYLYADPQRAGAWAARLARLGEPALPRVGLVWAGGHSDSSADARRSIGVDRLAPLLSYRGVRWISLQKAETDAKRLSGSAFVEEVVDWMDEIADFADTAALIDGLDMVIAVDTSVAHLAAAMGKRVWLLNRYAGCWRWLRDRDDSPWYPTMRLFTQRERNDWDEVLTRVRARLEHG